MKKVLSRKKVKLSVGLLLLICAVIGLTAAVLHIMRQPANGDVIKTNPTELTTPQPSVRTLDSKYFSTQYSGRYQLLPSTNASASLQSWTLVAHQEAGVGIQRKLSIVITKLPDGGVKEDSAYKLYAAHPELYQLSQAVYANDSVFVAKRTDTSYQQNILWPHDGYLLTVSLTSASQTDLADSELQSLLTALRWH